MYAKGTDNKDNFKALELAQNSIINRK